MTGLTRILVLLGLLVLGVALFVAGRSERPELSERPTPSSGKPVVGRSTLSHGGPGAGSLPVAPARSPSPNEQVPSIQASDATTR
ncbi:MAG: hypothetical protein R3B37_11115 [Nitrospira sp.]|nr:hypothetical protein [Nitrospira sp.]